jgi:hypothetical protein
MTTEQRTTEKTQQARILRGEKLENLNAGWRRFCSNETEADRISFKLE